MFLKLKTCVNRGNDVQSVVVYGPVAQLVRAPAS